MEIHSEKHPADVNEISRLVRRARSMRLITAWMETEAGVFVETGPVTYRLDAYAALAFLRSLLRFDFTDRTKESSLVSE